MPTYSTVAPSSGVSATKQVLIPAACAGMIGLAAIGGVQHSGGHICAPTEMCQPAVAILPDLPERNPSHPSPHHSYLPMATSSSTSTITISTSRAGETEENR
jgi:hypothetical protein